MTLELPSSALVTTDFVRVVRQIDSDRVSALVDSGKLLFVFNLSMQARAKIRELRFWISEVVTPQMVTRLTLDEVLDRILPPSRKSFWAAEVSRVLVLSRVTVAKLARLLGATLKNRTFVFSRSRLVAFLRSRWIGGRA